MEAEQPTHGIEYYFAKVASALLHPLLMPTYGFALLFYSRNYLSVFITNEYKLVVIGATFVFTFLLPALNALILLKMGRIRSLEMESTQERIIPYGSAALYYFALFYLFYRTGFPPVFKLFILGAGISILLTLLINFRWKISAHTVGVGGVVGAVLGIVYRLQVELLPIFLISLLAAGIVGYIRLKLKAHTPAQVYVGYLLGFSVEFLLLTFA